jgi:hypothetical protein
MAINKNFLQLEFGTGLFFIYSKEEKEGFEKHTSTKGNVSYRKYFKDGIKGVLESVSLYEGKFGNQISMNIKDGDEVYFTPVDIADQRGNVDSYAESLIKLLPALQKGDNVLVRGYNFTPEGDKYSKIGISITVNGEKLKPALTNAYTDKDGKQVEGQIPATVWKKDALGKNKPTAVSLEAKNDFLLEVVMTETERLKYVPSTEQTSAPAPKPQQSEPSMSYDSGQAEEDEDDLPF